MREGNNYCLKDIKLQLYSPVNKYVFMEVLERDLAKFIFHQIWLSACCVPGTEKSSQWGWQEWVSTQGTFGVFTVTGKYYQHLAPSVMDVKGPALTLGQKNCFGQRNVGSYGIVSVWAVVLRTVLCLHHSLMLIPSIMSTYPGSGCSPLPGPLTEKQTWEKGGDLKSQPSSIQPPCEQDINVCSEHWDLELFPKCGYHGKTN